MTTRPETIGETEVLRRMDQGYAYATGSGLDDTPLGKAMQGMVVEAMRDDTDAKAAALHAIDMALAEVLAVRACVANGSQTHRQQDRATYLAECATVTEKLQELAERTPYGFARYAGRFKKDVQPAIEAWMKECEGDEERMV